MKKPEITKDCIKTLLETPFLNVVDIQYAEGRHYFDASRHKPDEITAVKTSEEFKNMLADAVTCFLIIRTPAEEDRLLLTYEFRYPVGQFLLNPPAGLMDPADRETEDPLITAARREIYEETGIQLKDSDRIMIANPLVFSTPGMTDESNALICAVAELPDLSSLSQDNAEETECFDGFVLLTRQQAKDILQKGRDDNGNYLSVYAWAAMMYFLSGMWEK